jgi:hypothetical protein
MIDKNPEITALDPTKPTNVTESGELERPTTFARQIDCVGKSDITERRIVARPGRYIEDRRRAR